MIVVSASGEDTREAGTRPQSSAGDVALGNGFVQRADLMVRASEAGAPALLVGVDRRTENAHELVAKLRWHWEWGRLPPRGAGKRTVGLGPLAAGHGRAH